ncbi:Nif3-like dinuclear metal center hexameric protein [bacterium]|nr:Nif3-like dinuclear metal center hexameric protein [bacterium]
MVKIRDVVDVMETWAPSSLAESWDNTGLITGNPGDDVSHILITLDVDEETVTAAGETKGTMIVSHHPPIFRPLYNLTAQTGTARVIKQAIQHDISLFAAHTNLDQVRDGVSGALADKLGLLSPSILAPGTTGQVKFVVFVPPDQTDTVRDAAASAGAGIIGNYSLCSFTSRGLGTFKPSEAASPSEGQAGKLSKIPEDRIEMLVPSPLVSQVVEAARKAHPYEEMAYDLIPLGINHASFGYGAVGDMQTPMDQTEFAGFVARTLGCKTLRISRSAAKEIRRVAVMGGKGGDYICSAIKSGADAYVTGDIGYHDFTENGASIMLIDASHRATELPVLEKIRDRLLSSGIGKYITVTVHSGVDAIHTKIYS